jgi:uncharacterized membrane protein
MKFGGYVAGMKNTEDVTVVINAVLIGLMLKWANWKHGVKDLMMEIIENLIFIVIMVILIRELIRSYKTLFESEDV